MIGEIAKRKKGRPSRADLARRDVRRSSREKTVRYNLDLDDFEDEEEEDWRREKSRRKIKESDDEYEVETEVVQNQSRGHSFFLLSDVVDSEANDMYLVRNRKAGSIEADSAPGTPHDHPQDLPLPDKNTLELILDKLQKKDTYGVYAEPVDPDELPDYYDVIEHPMDFSTVRKKLGKGSYSTFEQFESDVLLICSNAMQYNAPDTIYHKQALSIQELAKRKFHRLRSGSEQNETLQCEQKPTSNSLSNGKQIKKLNNQIAPENVPSDLSAGATLANLEEDLQPGSKTNEGGLEKPTNVNECVDGTATPSDNNLDKSEGLPSGRGYNNKVGKKPLMNDEHRRSTYNHLSTEPVSRPDSAFLTFNDEIKQLVSVGLPGDHCYARSLARFAATLGPVAWNIASKRIEQSLLPDIKFGRGWVGDYEPISTPVLIKIPEKETIFHQELKSSLNPYKDDKIYNVVDSMPESPYIASQKEMILSPEFNSTSIPKADGKIYISVNAVHESPFIVSQKGTFSGKEVKSTCKPNRDVKNFSTLDSMHRNSILTCNSEGKSALSGAPVYTTASSATSYCLPSEPLSLRGEFSEVKSNNIACVSHQVQSPRVKNSQQEKKLNKEVILSSPLPLANQSPCQFSNPNACIPVSKSSEPTSRDKHPSISVPLLQRQNNVFVESGQVKLPNNGFDMNRTVTPVNDFSQMSVPKNYFPLGQEQGLTDPVQLMRSLTENAQQQQKSTNHSTLDNPLVPHSRKEDSSNATSAAARAWMSIGAGSPKPVSENRNQVFVNSLNNPAQVSRFRNDFPVYGMQLHPMNNNFPIQGFMAPQFQTGVETQFQNRPQTAFPQLATTDLSRFQMQSSPRQRQKRETSIPPDLNLVFQSSGSPRSQSSGVQMDSQQPDLALQL